MSDANLPADVLRLIESAVPTMDALELLVFLARNPDRQCTEREILSDIRPVVISAPAVKEHLALLQAQGVVSEKQPSCFQFDPTTPELVAAAAGLLEAYRERPVTLIRAVYAAAEKRRIQVFADVFKIKKD